MTARLQKQSDSLPTPIPTSGHPFVCALQIYCKHNDEDFAIIDNAMAWINGHSSYPTSSSRVTWITPRSGSCR